ncbi:MAG TPA: hypothetical protein VJ983_04495 [candidate division Zixibacteria bacterium]|nr:hypothetical protein [candidate division Zixibacteria bacterium]
MDSSVLTHLRIFDVDEILPFEWGEPSDSQSDETLIRHPFLVASLEEGEGYLLLDRAEEFRALVASGVPQLPIQLCADSDIELHIPRLGVTGFTEEDLNRLAMKHPDQIQIGDSEASAHHDQQFWQTVFAFGDSAPVNVWLRHSTQAGCPYPLEFIFRSIEQKGRYQPITGRLSDSGGVTRTTSYSATIELPSFGLTQLKRVALSDRLFPPRVVKAVPSYRVLHIDFPIAVLKSEISLSEKEAFLRELIGLREQSLKTEFYQGRIYLLNL